MHGYIYKTTNKKNHKVYIGQKIGSVRMNYLGSGLYIRRAINKYGEKNFKLEVLAYGKTKKQIDQLEKDFIASYRKQLGREKVYNLTDGGEGCWGLHPSKAQRKRWSKLRRGKNLARFPRSHFVKMAKKRGTPWNLGLTKETDERVKKSAKQLEGRPCIFKGKKGLFKHTEKAKRKMRRSQKTCINSGRWVKNDPRLLGNTFALHTGGR